MRWWWTTVTCPGRRELHRWSGTISTPPSMVFATSIVTTAAATDLVSLVIATPAVIAFFTIPSSHSGIDDPPPMQRSFLHAGWKFFWENGNLGWNFNFSIGIDVKKVVHVLFISGKRSTQINITSRARAGPGTENELEVCIVEQGRANTVQCFEHVLILLPFQFSLLLNVFFFQRLLLCGLLLLWWWFGWLQ